MCTDPGVGIPVPADRGWGSPVGRPILVGAFNPEGRGKLIWKIKTNNESFTLRYMKNLILLIIHESVKNKVHPPPKSNLMQIPSDHMKVWCLVLKKKIQSILIDSLV